MKTIDNIREYADSLRRKRPVLCAVKTGCVMARTGRVGEAVTTYVSSGITETTNYVRQDGNGRPDIVATAADASGNRITDSFGRTNTIIIPRETFDRKYTDAARVSGEEQLFRPAGVIQEFVQTDEDIAFRAPWGEAQRLQAGSYLNITDPENIYGIAYEEFMRTYTFTDEKECGQAPVSGMR